jgi:hypothetical protein
MTPVPPRLHLAFLLAVYLAGPALAQEPRGERLTFPEGRTDSRIEGSITGYDSIAYKVGAEAGQQMRVALEARNLSAYFNVYAPGQGPGDQALANSGFDGLMIPAINRFEATLPASGDYTILVYMLRAAARREETAAYTLDISLEGERAEKVTADYADGLRGGPDFWEVNASGRLNLRTAPSTGATIVVTLSPGETLRNLGCRMAEGRRWCNVAPLGNARTGWVAGDYLIESRSPGRTAAHD